MFSVTKKSNNGRDRSRKKRWWTSNHKACYCHALYNTNKAGVDRHDQMASYYPMHRKSVKWWQKTFFRLYTMGVINAHSYLNIHNHTKTCLEKLIKTVTKELAGVPVEPIPRVPGIAAEPRRHQEGDHFPLKIPPTAHKQKPTERCVHCRSKRDAQGRQIRHESSWKCLECIVALCTGCFFPYHRPHSRRR